MSKVRKAPMLAVAALVSFPLGGWDCGPWSQTKTTPGKKRAVRQKAKQQAKKKTTHKRVKRVKRSRTRTRSYSPEFSMPAGTAYDVIGCSDLQR